MDITLLKTANQISPRCTQGSSRASPQGAALSTTPLGLVIGSLYVREKCPVSTPAPLLLQRNIQKFAVRRVHILVMVHGRIFSEDRKSNLATVHSRHLARCPWYHTVPASTQGVRPPYKMPRFEPRTNAPLAHHPEVHCPAHAHSN